MRTTIPVPVALLCFACAQHSAGPAQQPAAPPPSPVAAAAPALSSTPAGKQAAPEPQKFGPEVALVSVKNPLAEPRTQVTVSIPADTLRKLWLDPGKTVLVDSAGQPVLSQLVDFSGDELPDELVFQTDFKANESKTFSLRIGERKPFSREQYRVYGRFVRERHDDFAWENDRVARRAYGPDLETYPREPLTSSGIDVWVKSAPKLVINDWYMLDRYHDDSGEGGDFYTVGKSRGCGGLGVWEGGKLHVSKNFQRSRVLANGPIRLVFELSYAPWDADGTKVEETRRIVLDAGSSFERVESELKASGKAQPWSVGVGIAKHSGSSAEFEKQQSVLRSWEPFKDNHGNLGCALVLPPGSSAEYQALDNDYVMITPPPKSGPLVYYSGMAWDKRGEVPDMATWGKTVQTFARGLAAPVELNVTAAAGAKPWAARTCDSVMERSPEGLNQKWEYDSGLVLMACYEVYSETKNQKYFDYVKRSIDSLIGSDGTIKGYKLEDYNIDQVNEGKVVFDLWRESKSDADKARYKKALDTLRSQMKTHPRTKEGGFWHKKIYENQMWLDGLYMASPFLAEYAVTFNEPALLDDVARQITLIEKHTRDPKTGLLYHGWDESKQQKWANAKTGTSPNFWGRSVGWYAMAIVDTLEFMPKNHPQRAAILGVLDRLAAAISGAQDPMKGVWWQVLDAPKKSKNYLEASASSMFVYALAKAARNGWIDAKKYAPVATRGYRGILSEFVEVSDKGTLDLKNVCKVAGLGGNPYRDGTYEYYTTTEVVKNDPKGIGAFILASTELNKTGN